MMDGTQMTQQTQGADVIEQDIVQTQNEISDTVNELQGKLQPQQLLRQVVGNPQEVPGQLFDAVKRNPLAAGLVGIGTLWLLSGKEAKLPTFKRGSSSKETSSYDAHLASVVRYDGESEEIYQDRIDAARASYLGVEKSDDEQPHGFRARLDKLTEGLRSKASSLTPDSLSGLTGTVKDRSRGVRDWSKGKHNETPVAVGLAVAAAGAVVALALPKTQIEREKLGSLGEAAMAKAAGLKDQALEAAGHKLDGSDQAGAGSTKQMAG